MAVIPAKKYVTMENDMVDLIAYDRYGRTRGAVEAILDANPGLGERGPILPRGIVIYLPSLEDTPPKRKVINLWD